MAQLQIKHNQNPPKHIQSIGVLTQNKPTYTGVAVSGITQRLQCVRCLNVNAGSFVAYVVNMSNDRRARQL